MPRYPLEEGSVEDLLAYMRCVGRDPDPGVSPDLVRVGVALPRAGKLAPAAADVAAVLSAVFSAVNMEGGIFRRRIELVFEDASRGDAWERLARADVFALVGSMDGGADGASRDGLEDMPIVAPVAPWSGDEEDVFSVHPGPDVLAQVAVKHAAGVPLTAPILIVFRLEASGESWARGARTEAARRGLAVPSAHAFAAGRFDAGDAAESVRSSGAAAVLFNGSAAELGRLVEALESLPEVVVYAPGSLGAVTAGGPQASAARRVLFVHPGLVDGVAGARAEELRAWMGRHGIAVGHLAFQVSAYVAANALIEALKRAGAGLTREGLVRALETFRDVDVGPAPPLSFGRGRRTGVMGASIVQIDSAAGTVTRASGWLGVTP
jgi:ABC-type branched-subunit amino acid transport system substrate-binding protein